MAMTMTESHKSDEIAHEKSPILTTLAAGVVAQHARFE
jgi:hypothetical protein